MCKCCVGIYKECVNVYSTFLSQRTVIGESCRWQKEMSRHKKTARLSLSPIIDTDKIHVYYDMYVENIKNDVLTNIHFFTAWTTVPSY